MAKAMPLRKSEALTSSVVTARGFVKGHGFSRAAKGKSTFVVLIRRRKQALSATAWLKPCPFAAERICERACGFVKGHAALRKGTALAVPQKGNQHLLF